jgi:hypothetical protein
MHGRVLGIALREPAEVVAADLLALGFTQERAQDVAAAALKYSAEETEDLMRRLTPRASWIGLVVGRRHHIARQESSWLLLRYDRACGWVLDSALFP